VELIDMAPTILHMLGLPVSKEMDGKVAAGLFDADFLRWRPVCYEDASGNVVAASLEGVDEQEQKELVRSLKGLGYLS
jgi:arylsulfatase A-like enzyme